MSGERFDYHESARKLVQQPDTGNAEKAAGFEFTGFLRMIRFLQPKREMSDNNEEKIFMEGEGQLISNKRIVVGTKTYALNLVTSVDVNSRRTGPWLLFGKPAYLVLIVPWILAVPVGALLINVLPDIADQIPILLFICLLVPTLVGFFKKLDLQYWVEITTASGTEQVLCCDDDEDYALEIVEAINQAIVSK